MIAIRLVCFLSLSTCTNIHCLHQANDPFLSTADSLIFEFRMKAWASVYTPIVLKSIFNPFG